MLGGGGHPYSVSGDRRPGPQRPLRGVRAAGDRSRARSGLLRVRENLRQLAANPAAADHAERINALVASPEPLIRLLAEELATGGNGIDAMLEAMTRRYYKVRTLRNVRTFHEGGRPYVTGDFERSGQDLHLVATAAEHGDRRPR